MITMTPKQEQMVFTDLKASTVLCQSQMGSTMAQIAGSENPKPGIIGVAVKHGLDLQHQGSRPGEGREISKAPSFGLRSSVSSTHCVVSHPD